MELQQEFQPNEDGAQRNEQEPVPSAHSCYRCPNEWNIPCPPPLSEEAHRQWKITADQIDKWLKLVIPEGGFDWTIVLHRNESDRYDGY